MSADPTKNTIPGEEHPAEEQEGPHKPVIVLTMTSSHMEMDVELQRTSPNTLAPVFEDVMAAIEERGVVFGVREETIRSLCQTPKFNVPILIARGIAPQTGEDGHVEYLVQPQKELRPKLRSDGTVDYRDLGLIENVQAGQVLCTIHPPTKGQDGKDLFGNVLEGKMGKEPAKVNGKNTEYSEDGLQLLSQVDGNVEVSRGTVSVNTLLKISGNVDNSTGDINFVGDIQVNGDILSGFTVISGGNITVKGTVEGAVIQAAGDIVVNEGINGMTRGSLTAGGSVRCKYIQSCFIKAGQNIYADSMMYCTVECAGNLELSGKRGVLIGGKATVAKALTAKTIGTSSHIATQVVMNPLDTRLIVEKQNLAQQMKALDGEELKLSQIINRVTDLRKIGRATPELEASAAMVENNRLQIQASRQKLQQQLAQVEEQLFIQSNNNTSHIECKGRIHVGVTLVFSSLTMQVATSFVYSRVSVIEGEIRISPMGKS